MKEIVSKLREFHKKQRFELDHPLQSCQDARTTALLSDLAADLKLLTIDLERQCTDRRRDVRLRRAQLMVEETGEVVEAMRDLDEEKLCDGLADDQFVTIGTSETFGLPTRDALVEVCDSNLTKDLRAVEDHRLRHKGPNYRPPDMRRVIDDFRARLIGFDEH